LTSRDGRVARFGLIDRRIARRGVIVWKAKTGAALPDGGELFQGSVIVSRLGFWEAGTVNIDLSCSIETLRR
jgi:hypothetical protein